MPDGHNGRGFINHTHDRPAMHIPVVVGVECPHNTSGNATRIGDAMSMYVFPSLWLHLLLPFPLQ